MERDFVNSNERLCPSAYKERAAIILSSPGEDTASLAAIFALRSLNVGKIYTVGFKVRGSLAIGVEPFTSVQSVQKADNPFVIIPALPPDNPILSCLSFAILIENRGSALQAKFSWILQRDRGNRTLLL